MRASTLLTLALLCLSITAVEGKKKQCIDRKSVTKCVKKAAVKCKKKKWVNKKCCRTCKSYAEGELTRKDGKLDCKTLGTGEITFEQGATAAAAKSVGVCAKPPSKYERDGDILVKPINGNWQQNQMLCDSDRMYCFVNPTPEKCTSTWSVPISGKTGASTLVHSGDNVFLGTQDAVSYSLDAATGATKFKNNIQSQSCPTGASSCNKGFTQISSVQDGMVYNTMSEYLLYSDTDDDGSDDDDSDNLGLVIQGKIVALDTMGAGKWIYANGDMISGICLDDDTSGRTFGGRTYWTTKGPHNTLNTTKTLTALDSKTGTLLWELEFPLFDADHGACQNRLHFLGDANTLYAVANEKANGEAYVAVYKFALLENGNVTKLWNVSLDVPMVGKESKPILSSGNGGQLILTSDNRGAVVNNETNPATAACVYAVSTADGSVKWKHDIAKTVIEGASSQYSTGNSWIANSEHILYNDHVYLRTTTLIGQGVYQKSLRAIHELGGHQIFSTVISNMVQTPTLAADNDVIYLADKSTASLSDSPRDKGILYWHSATDGVLKAKVTLDGAITSGPILGTGKVFLSHSVVDPSNEDSKDKAHVVAFSTDSAQSGCGA